MECIPRRRHYNDVVMQSGHFRNTNLSLFGRLDTAAQRCTYVEICRLQTTAIPSDDDDAPTLTQRTVQRSMLCASPAALSYLLCVFEQLRSIVGEHASSRDSGSFRATFLDSFDHQTKPNPPHLNSPSHTTSAPLAQTGPIHPPQS
ncbi:hypothetical protein CBL_09355 [Carabus blaptoides fortunei]